MELLKSRVDAGDEVVLVSQGLDHVMRPLAQHLGVKWMIANRLEFRDGIATGRLLDPVIRPRGLFARHHRRRARRQARGGAAGPRPGSARTRKLCRRAVVPAAAQTPGAGAAHRLFRRRRATPAPLSVRQALAGKHVMLIGVTGFIGKVWLVNTLMDLPEIGRIYLLIRRQKSNPALQALREAGGGVSGLRSAVRALRSRAGRFLRRTGGSRGGRRLRSPAWVLRPEVSRALCSGIST